MLKSVATKLSPAVHRRNLGTSTERCRCHLLRTQLGNDRTEEHKYTDYGRCRESRLSLAQLGRFYSDSQGLLYHDFPHQLWA